MLVRAFGPPEVLADMLAGIDDMDAAYILGSWAAHFQGDRGERPVADIDVLAFGTPDRDELYAAASAAESRLGRPVQDTIRPADWLRTGTGNFHATVSQRPLVPVELRKDRIEPDSGSR